MRKRAMPNRLIWNQKKIAYCIESGSSIHCFITRRLDSISLLFSDTFELLFKISGRSHLLLPFTIQQARPLGFDRVDLWSHILSFKAQNALRIALSRSFENLDAEESLRRLAASMTMFKVMAEPAAHTLGMIGEFQLAELKKSLNYPSDNKLRKTYFYHVAGTPETVMQRLRDIEQTLVETQALKILRVTNRHSLILRRIERLVVRSEQLHLEREAESNKSQQAVAEIDQALSLYKSHMQALAEIGYKLAKISSLSVGGDASDRTFNELPAALQSTIDRSQGFGRNRVVSLFLESYSTPAYRTIRLIREYWIERILSAG
ncbi:hypothetical protein CCUS01_13246 [Colletotrichum cuscutae]|uniref:Uncharacterized protein n=1 Tax=Colletotrichum cuscutae TaxID=1209917 RepID=A0AAI9YCF0_9PEZI|nr:hypothetical protein CCUS01_13246 [Colletotrichum cuscutae]